MKETLSLRSGMSVRQRQLIFAVIAGCFIFGILVWGTTMPESAYAVDYGQKNLVPSAAHPFGTDHMGRDMLLRSVKGMSISLQIGIAAAFVSSCIALVLGTLSAAFGGKVDQFVLWLVDLCMGVPHILLILMISVMMGGGIMGVSVGVIVTHWPRLTRIIRAEVMQLRTQPYILAARQYGYSCILCRMCCRSTSSDWCCSFPMRSCTKPESAFSGTACRLTCRRSASSSRSRCAISRSACGGLPSSRDFCCCSLC